jgi:hypothetical protein
MYTFIDIHRMRQDTDFGAKQILRMRLLVIGTSKKASQRARSDEVLRLSESLKSDERTTFCASRCSRCVSQPLSFCKRQSLEKKGKNPTAECCSNLCHLFVQIICRFLGKAFLL